MIGKKDLTMRSSGLGGCNPKVVGGSFWFVLSVVSAMPVEAPKPLNAGVILRYSVSIPLVANSVIKGIL